MGLEIIEVLARWCDGSMSHGRSGCFLSVGGVDELVLTVMPVATTRLAGEASSIRTTPLRSFCAIDRRHRGEHAEIVSDRPVDLGRRRLCQGLCGASGLVALRALPGCGGTGPGGQTASCSPSAVGVGDAPSLATGQARYIESLRIFVCHDSGGYYAIDSACTHVGTNIEFQSAVQGFRCPLHGATFDFGGKVTMGPAMRDLPHYELCTTPSGLLIVDTGKMVTEDTRLLV